MLEYIDNYFRQILFESFATPKLIKFKFHLFIFSKPIFEILNIYRLSTIFHAENLLINLLSFLVLVKLYKPLHDDTYDKNMHEVISHQEVDHKEDS